MHRSKTRKRPFNKSRQQTSRSARKHSPVGNQQTEPHKTKRVINQVTEQPRSAEVSTFSPDNRFGLLHPLIQTALKEKGYQQPTPIQNKAIKPQLDGRDLIGCSQTGTGKTAAFVLPLLQKLKHRKTAGISKAPKALVLAPTRELAKQIEESVSEYGQRLAVKKTVIYGGVGQQPQVSALRRGVDIVIATPGRLLDLMRQRALELNQVETLIVDEADRMLDMGFLPDIKRILQPIPKSRQTVLFSATFPPEIKKLIESIATNPVQVSIAPEKPAVERIRQRVVFTQGGHKDKLLTQLLVDNGAERAIVFTKMKHAANRLVKKLDQEGLVATAIHGNKSQSARERSLQSFRRGATRILVATDIAARGLDIKAVNLVINYDLPTQAENYIHRIGRTARAGAEGEAVSFVTDKERPQLKSIEHLLRTSIAKQPTPAQTSGDRPPRQTKSNQQNRSRKPNRFRSRRRSRVTQK